MASHLSGAGPPRAPARNGERQLGVGSKATGAAPPARPTRKTRQEFVHSKAPVTPPRNAPSSLPSRGPGVIPRIGGGGEGPRSSNGGRASEHRNGVVGRGPSSANRLGAARGGAAPRPRPRPNADREEAPGTRLARTIGAERSTAPAWQTRGLGVGKEFGFGEGAQGDDELLKPGLTRAALREMEQRTKFDADEEPDPFGEVYRTTQAQDAKASDNQDDSRGRWGLLEEFADRWALGEDAIDYLSSLSEETLQEVVETFRPEDDAGRKCENLDELGTSADELLVDFARDVEMRMEVPPATVNGAAARPRPHPPPGPAPPLRSRSPSPYSQAAPSMLVGQRSLSPCRSRSRSRSNDMDAYGP